MRKTKEQRVGEIEREGERPPQRFWITLLVAIYSRIVLEDILQHNLINAFMAQDVALLDATFEPIEGEECGKKKKRGL